MSHLAFNTKYFSAPAVIVHSKQSKLLLFVKKSLAAGIISLSNSISLMSLGKHLFYQGLHLPAYELGVLNSARR